MCRKHVKIVYSVIAIPQWAWFRKNEAGLIFLVLGRNSIYSLDRHLLAKF